MSRWAGLLLVPVLFAPAGCCILGLSGVQPVALRPQETSMWCWAASGEMCMDFLGTDVSQCDQANKLFSKTICCSGPTPAECVQGGWPEFEKYDFDYMITPWGIPLTWNQIKQEICGKRPITFSWGWSGGGGHGMVAIGFVTIDSQRYVLVNDPWPPNVGAQYLITYERFVSDTGHTHWVDYYDIKKQ